MPGLRLRNYSIVSEHQSVLLQESIVALELKPGRCVVDCTVGAGGHAAAFIGKIGPGGRLIGLDVDPDALRIARERLEPAAKNAGVELLLVQSNFSRIASVLSEKALLANAIFADLGVSSMQFDRPERGFSFRFDQPLDRRMDPTLPRTAADLVNELTQEQLADLIFQLGEERGSRRIARAIVEQRQREPLRTTGQLEALVRRALRVREHRRIHPATKTFQALRLAVNREMESLTALLEAAPETLSVDGTLAIVSFHSLEDRLVKQRCKALAATGRFQQTVKLVRPGKEELAQNLRSRSAKLRAVKRISS
jgi:16S rRNA (cytosine1402-N4)-methyltransferase